MAMPDVSGQALPPSLREAVKRGISDLRGLLRPAGGKDGDA